MPAGHYQESPRVFLADPKNSYTGRMNTAATARSASSDNHNPDSLIMRTLLAAARHRTGLDETSCWLVLEWLQTGLAVQDVLRQTLASHHLTELKFSILVTLFTLDPSPTTEADLANHARVTRPSVSRALDELQARRLVARVPDDIDHRYVNVHLTKKGHATIDEAIQQYLKAAGRLARFLEKDVQTAATIVCARLRSGAESTG